LVFDQEIQDEGFGFHTMRFLPGLSGKFGVPPFSVLRMDSSEWKRRKKQWLSLGIRSEIGRSSKLTFGEWGLSKFGKDLSQTSVFDPVLCELMYSWFCPSGGQIIDPFAGGSVRGIVAAVLGRRYWGCDLRKEQIESNNIQAEKILTETMTAPVWVCGDSFNEAKNAPLSDFVFSCPPYGDLERYSDISGDLSNFSDYSSFLNRYEKIIYRTLKRLKDNRFACFVVGNYRDKKSGKLRNFVGDTVRIFDECGAYFYNEMILVSPAGTLENSLKKAGR